ncbi:MAG: sialate O-acetylesterase [Opitutaceae bacterium]|jgi:sialate O-acetylesterase|nr:sialate O-acetylesterase [Opitutaceae bacterium]
MKPIPLRIFVTLAAFALCAVARADITLAPLFTDHAVLQCGKPVPIWGTADVGETVRVTFLDQTQSTTAGDDGRWRVTLDPLVARSEPATLTVVGKNTVTLTDILVGEVWLASGQSNMGWIVRNTFDADLDVPASTNPLIRHVKIQQTVADAPATTVAIDRSIWETASPATTANFTAVGYYFAREIQAHLGVPVGIINSSWGGTPAEAWTDPDTLARNPAFAYVAAAWADTLAAYPEKNLRYIADLAAWESARDAAKSDGQPFNKPALNAPAGPGHRSTPSGLYNAMIHPLVPYALRGAIWFQGENNANRQPERYHELFSALITGWRARFGQGDFPFYWAQLSSFGYFPTNNNTANGDATNWAVLREAQTKTLALPATGQAITIDVGHHTDIHPRNKRAVGQRLARLALNRDYGIKLQDSGPTFDKAVIDGATFRVSFTQVGGGLTTPFRELTGFEIAGADRVFHPATAAINGATVVVSSPTVTDPVALRYSWRNAPLGGLFNQSGLPAVPFRTDAW